MKPGAPSLQSSRLLDQVRERIRYGHYIIKIDKNYLYLILFFHALAGNLAGYWSRRIDDTHRLFYAAHDGAVLVVACRFHYGDE